MLTLIGYPLAAGFVVESMDNSRKGYPTPLPPWYDWTTRYLIGIFTLLIDFVFFVLPLLVTGFLLFCASVGILVFNLREGVVLRDLLTVLGGAGGLVLLGLFLSGVAPVARLIYVDEGRIEEALSVAPLRRALNPLRRGAFWRSRLASLAAYLPVLVLGTALSLLARVSFAGQFVVLGALVWLTLSALLYAHLVVAQLYVAAEKAAFSGGR